MKRYAVRRVNILITTVIMFFLVLLVLNKTLLKGSWMNTNLDQNMLNGIAESEKLTHSIIKNNDKNKDTNFNEKVYSYLKSSSHEKSVFNAAIILNGKTSSNSCVYFISEVLRRNGVEIPKEIGNTSQIVPLLQQKGFQKYTNYKDLQPGDIVFTTDESGNKNGVPSHTYVFMKWVEKGSYDYAYICDNQAKDYENQIYHIRNIKNKDSVNGIPKDAFSFFMRPE
ncbi:hypothetical protein [Candidatus Clostridium stratigraminis]|uniref:Bacteriophage peptidoglycan hydrolase n=1 Tax=Candidatus Clostridium stratigraminis TaxID=3381661 RepID=A0ABW8T3D4_9CLOT